jgi:hypothetical protein
MRSGAIRTLPGTIVVVLVAACQSTLPAGQPAAPGGAQRNVPTAAVTAPPAQTVAPFSFTPGSWTVTLSGPMTGAGTHRGSGLVACTLLPFDGSGELYWGASMADLTAPFGELSDWTMSEQPGSEQLHAIVGGLEGGVWVAVSTSGTASITGSGAADHTGHVSGQGSFSYSVDGPLFTIAIDANCSDVTDNGGTD